MRINKLCPGILLLTGILMLAMSGCEYDAPGSIWDSRPEGNPTPTISAMNPEVGVPGANELTLVGTNFSPNAGDNTVYFDNAQAEIITASSTEITVLRPAIVGDAIDVTLAIAGVVELAKFDGYEIDQVHESYGLIESSEIISSFTVDNDENILMAMQSRDLVKLTPDGSKTVIGNTGTLASDMKVAADGSLYIQRRNHKLMYHFTDTMETAVEFFEWTNKMFFFDLDENGNGYAGGRNTYMGLHSADGTSSNGPEYIDFEILAVRVFNGYVYVLAMAEEGDEPTGIYKHEITSSAGSVGERELVADLSYLGEEPALTDIAIGDDGSIYVATEGPDPILVVNTDGSIYPFYKDILVPTAVEIEWGTGNYMYQRLGGDNYGLERIDMGGPGT